MEIYPCGKTLFWDEKQAVPYKEKGDRLYPYILYLGKNIFALIITEADSARQQNKEGPLLTKDNARKGFTVAYLFCYNKQIKEVSHVSY